MGKYKNVKELGLKLAELEILHDQSKVSDEEALLEVVKMCEFLKKDISTKFELNIELPLPPGISLAID